MGLLELNRYPLCTYSNVAFVEHLTDQADGAIHGLIFDERDRGCRATCIAINLKEIKGIHRGLQMKKEPHTHRV